MKQQVFSRELQGTFNLREPKATKPTMIYFVVRLNGRQYKLSTGVKVYPTMWAKDTQTAIVSNQLSKQDNRNNKLVNEKINEVNANFLKFISYLCNAENIGNEYDVLRTFIYKEMKKKDINTLAIIENAFDYYYKYVNPTAKVGTIKTNEESLNIFKKYISEKNLEKDLNVFSQSGFNAFRDYLIRKGNAPKRINELCQLVARLINKVLCVNDDFLKYNFRHVEFVSLKDTRTNDEIGHFPLMDDEVKKLKNCKNLSPKLERTRRIFLFEIKCGWRYSDVKKFMHGKYEQSGNVITIKTKKKEIPAYLNIDEETKELIENLNGINPPHISNYNINLKELAKVAGLNRVVNYKDSKGVEVNEPIHEKISSHWARFTMINNEIKKGTPIEIIVKKAGHKDDAMIRKIYTKLTKDEKVQAFADYYEKEKANEVEVEKEMQHEPTIIKVDSEFAYNKGKEEKENELIKEAKEVLLFLGADAIEINDINNLDDLSLLIYVDYARKFNFLGIDTRTLKKVFNTPNATLKEKKEALNKLVIDAKEMERRNMEIIYNSVDVNLSIHENIEKKKMGFKISPNQIRKWKWEKENK